MNSFSLIPFNNDGPKISSTVSLGLKSSSISLSYEFKGNIQDILFPSSNPSPQRVTNLWERTCFELFIQNSQTKEYYEYNFSPSGDWNCFHFSKYREGLSEFSKALPPAILKAQESSKSISYCVEIPFPLSPKSSYHFGLSAVIQSPLGKISYWSLSHPNAEKADFHDSRSYINLI